MKYTTELVEKLTSEYGQKTAKELADEIGVPERSVIAKLSSMGIYKKKEYLNKRGEPPVKKEEYIERIATMLDIDSSLLESMEKVTKSALVLLEKQIKALSE
jgi:Zn-dependent peptidase ImmA (M78 family)